MVSEAGGHEVPTVGYRSAGGLRESVLDGRTGIPIPNFPLTALVRFDGRLADLGRPWPTADVGDAAVGVQLYNPLAVQSARVQGRAVPLETNLTTPLAYLLAKMPLNDLAWNGFLRRPA